MPAPSTPDKAAVLEAIRKALAAAESRTEASSRENAASATDPESRAEDKYDTRALEASYLAAAQAQRTVERRAELAAFHSLLTQPAPPNGTVGVGSLLCLRERSRRLLYFLGPASGGLDVHVGDATITVITPTSPLSRLLLGRSAGHTFTWPPGPAGKPHTLESVS